MSYTGTLKEYLSQRAERMPAIHAGAELQNAFGFVNAAKGVLAGTGKLALKGRALRKALKKRKGKK